MRRRERRGKARALRLLKRTRKKRDAARELSLRDHRASEARERLGIVGHEAESAFEKRARFARVTRRRPQRRRASPHRAGFARRAARHRFHFFDVGNRIAQPTERDARGGSRPMHARRSRRARDRAIEPEKTFGGVRRDARAVLERDRGERRRDFFVGCSKEGRRCRGRIARFERELAEQRRRKSRVARVRQNRARGLRATRHDAIDVGDAATNFGMPRRALETIQIERTCALEIALNARVVRFAKKRRALFRAHGLLGRFRSPAPRDTCKIHASAAHVIAEKRTPRQSGARAPASGRRTRAMRDGAFSDREANTLTARDASDHRFDGLRRERDRGRVKRDAARTENDEAELVFERIDRDLECKRTSRRIVGDSDRRAPRTHGDPRLRRTFAEQTAELRRGVARERIGGHFERHPFEHAASMTKPLNAARHVDGKSHRRQRERELCDFDGADFRGSAELPDAEPISTDRQTQLDRRARFDPRGLRRGRSRHQTLAKLRRQWSRRRRARRHASIVQCEVRVRELLRRAARYDLYSPSCLAFAMSSAATPSWRKACSRAFSFAKVSSPWPRRWRTRFAREEPLLVGEAGTGTGKTLAYLVPAILSGRKSRRLRPRRARCKSKSISKDLPIVAEALAVHGIRFRAALMKGLSTYACKRRLNEALASGDVIVPFRLRKWVDESEAGDRAELADMSEDDPAWAQIQSSTETRIGADCKYFEECFVTRMKRDAEEADVVVVNHHLFCAVLVLRRNQRERASAIPAYDAVIFDEAHQLEDVATTFFGSTISMARIDALARDARRALGLAKRSCRGRFRIKMIEAAHAFFAELARPPPRRDDSPPSSRFAVGARRAIARDAWSAELESARARLSTTLSALVADARTRHDPAAEPIARRATELASVLGGDSDGRNEIAWVETRGNGATVMGRSPVYVGDALAESLFSRVRAVVCTSATLATHHRRAAKPKTNRRRRLSNFCASASAFRAMRARSSSHRLSIFPDARGSTFRATFLRSERRALRRSRRESRARFAAR